MTQAPEWQSIVPADEGQQLMRLSAEAIDEILSQETLLDQAPDLRTELENVRITSEWVAAQMADVSRFTESMRQRLHVVRLTHQDRWMRPLAEHVQARTTARVADVGYRGERRAVQTAFQAAEDLDSQNKAAWVPLESRLIQEHTFTEYRNPHLVCKKCFQPVQTWHNPETCPCDQDAWWNEPCGHVSTIHSICSTFSLGDELRCKCEEMGAGPHEGEEDEDEDDAQVVPF